MEFRRKLSRFICLRGLRGHRASSPSFLAGLDDRDGVAGGGAIAMTTAEKVRPRRVYSQIDPRSRADHSREGSRRVYSLRRCLSKLSCVWFPLLAQQPVNHGGRRTATLTPGDSGISAGPTHLHLHLHHHHQCLRHHPPTSKSSISLTYHQRQETTNGGGEGGGKGKAKGKKSAAASAAAAVSPSGKTVVVAAAISNESPTSSSLSAAAAAATAAANSNSRSSEDGGGGVRIPSSSSSSSSNGGMRAGACKRAISLRNAQCVAEYVPYKNSHIAATLSSQSNVYQRNNAPSESYLPLPSDNAALTSDSDYVL